MGRLILDSSFSALCPDFDPSELGKNIIHTNVGQAAPIGLKTELPRLDESIATAGWLIGMSFEQLLPIAIEVARVLQSDLAKLV